MVGGQNFNLHFPDVHDPSLWYVRPAAASLVPLHAAIEDIRPGSASVSTRPVPPEFATHLAEVIAPPVIAPPSPGEVDRTRARGHHPNRTQPHHAPDFIPIPEGNFHQEVLPFFEPARVVTEKVEKNLTRVRPQGGNMTPVELPAAAENPQHPPSGLPAVPHLAPRRVPRGIGTVNRDRLHLPLSGNVQPQLKMAVRPPVGRAPAQSPTRSLPFPAQPKDSSVAASAEITEEKIQIRPSRKTLPKPLLMESSFRSMLRRFIHPAGVSRRKIPKS
jgi:hypothetical protein